MRRLVSGANAVLAPCQSGVICFDRVNVSNFHAPRHKTYGPTPVQAFGTLKRPTDLGAKVSAMGIEHGSSGSSRSREFQWANYLNNPEIAAVGVDDFTPRDSGESATPLSPTNLITDALTGY